MAAAANNNNNNDVALSSFGMCISGGLASIVASTVTHPLDLIKVRFQLTNELVKANTHPSIIGTAINIYKYENGIQGFYNGLTATILRQSIYSTTRFGFYDKLKNLRLQHSNNSNKTITVADRLLLGSASGMLAGLLSSPADLVMVRMQADKKKPPNLRRNYRNAIDGLHQIYSQEGLFSLWRGCAPNVWRGTIVTCSQFASYESFKSLLLHNSFIQQRIFNFRDNLFTHFVASLQAGVIAATVCSPIDVIRTRMMNTNNVQLAANNQLTLAQPQYHSIADVTKKIFRIEGLRGFYKGWLAYYIRVGPHVTLMFMFFEQFQQLGKLIKANNPMNKSAFS
jgi:hypothetical protein